MLELVKKFIELATENQLQTAKDGRIVWMLDRVDANRFIKAGFPLLKDGDYYRITSEFTLELSRALDVKHGHPVKVIGIADHFNPDNGAFEIASLSDKNGVEFVFSNAPYPNICFRAMTSQQILDFIIYNFYKS